MKIRSVQRLKKQTRKKQLISEIFETLAVFGRCCSVHPICDNDISNLNEHLQFSNSFELPILRVSAKKKHRVIVYMVYVFVAFVVLFYSSFRHIFATSVSLNLSACVCVFVTIHTHRENGHNKFMCVCVCLCMSFSFDISFFKHYSLPV